MGRPAIDLVGKKFGKLEVVRRHNVNTNSGSVRWVCLCDCGNQTIARGSHLKDGGRVSCGCIQHSHNLSKHPLYRRWRGIVRRCTYKDDSDYKNYGARGIKVCDRWMDFRLFVEDLDAMFIEAKSEIGEDCQIDRINNDGDYELSNVRFITPKQNRYNSRAINFFLAISKDDDFFICNNQSHFASLFNLRQAEIWKCLNRRTNKNEKRNTFGWKFYKLNNIEDFFERYDIDKHYTSVVTKRVDYSVLSFVDKEVL